MSRLSLRLRAWQTVEESSLALWLPPSMQWINEIRHSAIYVLSLVDGGASSRWRWRCIWSWSKKKVRHWNRAEILSPGSRRPTKSRAKPSPLLFHTTWDSFFEKRLTRPHTSLRRPLVHCALVQNMARTNTNAIKNWFPQLAVSFCWKSAREDFCSILISENDIWDDCGHSPDQKGSRLGQKQSQGMSSGADVSISTTLHC